MEVQLADWIIALLMDFDVISLLGRSAKKIVDNGGYKCILFLILCQKCSPVVGI